MIYLGFLFPYFPLSRYPSLSDSLTLIPTIRSDWPPKHIAQLTSPMAVIPMLSQGQLSV
jgi:hypothetical protein